MKPSASIQQKTKSKKINTVSVGIKKASKKVTRNMVVVNTSRKPLSRVAYTAKKYGKRTLRAMLLSHMFHTTFKIVAGLAISGAVLHGAYLYIGRTFADDIIVSQSEIISRISKLTEIPKDMPEDIVRVQNPDDLRKQNSFYENVKEGDYIVMYPKLAVIYDLRSNSIVAVKKIDK